MDQKRRRLTLPMVGSVVALLLSPLAVILTGEMGLYAIALFPLVVVLWAVIRLSRREIGIQFGESRGYILSLIYPLGVMALTGGIAWVCGGIQADAIPVIRLGKGVVILFLVTFVVGLITEEGFFRGWLWGALQRGGFEPRIVLVWTSVAFSLWHVAVPFVGPLFRFPLTVVPVYVANVFLIGMIFGSTRLASGSILAPALCHALWNALTYTLYGYGAGAGALELSSYRIYDPERGVLGLLLNLTAVIILRPWQTRRQEGKGR